MGWGTYWGTGWGNTSFQDVIAKELEVAFTAVATLSSDLVTILTISSSMTGVGTMTSVFADNIQNLDVLFTAIATLFTQIREDDLGPNPIIPPKLLFTPTTIIPNINNISSTPKLIIPNKDNILLIPKLVISKKKLN